MVGLVWFIFSFSGFACCAIGGLLWLRARPGAPGPRRFLSAVATLYLLASLYPVDRVVARGLTHGFHALTRVDVPPGTTVVVLLGSGNFTARSWSDEKFAVVDPIGAMRIVEAARVFRLIDPDWVISSGGTTRGDEGATASVAALMRDDLVRLGVPDSRILLEAESQSTRDEAVAIEQMLRSLHARHVVLVTSDVHMRRSVWAFRAVGVETIPAIARDVFVTLPWYRWALPSNDGLVEASLVAHEVFGIGYYGIRGWLSF